MSAPSPDPNPPHESLPYIFIYGSLLPHVPHSRFHLLQPARFIAQAQIPGTLYDLRGYPGATFSPPPPTTTPKIQPSVQGEIFELLHPKATLPQMDDYEGFDPAHPESSEFVRHSVTAFLLNGSTQLVWVYSYNRDTTHLPVIPDGNYRAHVEQHPPLGR